MSNHSKFVNALMKSHLVEEKQRSIKEIRRKIEDYEKENLELISQYWPSSPEYKQKQQINDNDLRIKALKWTIYDE
jgi:hypothetical protein